MNGLPLVPPSRNPAVKVLLLGASAAQQNVRAEALRRFGVEVDCVRGAVDGRSLWQAGSYNLVLIDAGNQTASAVEFGQYVKHSDPSQLMAFLVGRPEYLASAPNPEAACPAPVESSRPTPSAPEKNNGNGVPSGRFLEVAQKILVMKSRRGAPPERASRIESPRPVEERVSSSFGDAIRRAEATTRGVL